MIKRLVQVFAAKKLFQGWQRRKARKRPPGRI